MLLAYTPLDRLQAENRLPSETILSNPIFRIDYLRAGPPFRYQHYYYFLLCPTSHSHESSIQLEESFLREVTWPRSSEKVDVGYGRRKDLVLLGGVPECWVEEIRSFVIKRESPSLSISLCHPYVRFERVFDDQPLIEEDICPPDVLAEFGLVTDSLRQEDIPFIQPFHAINLPDEFVSMTIKVCPSICVRHPESEKLVAWMVQYLHDGQLGFLEVVPEMRRRGLAVYVVNLLAHKVKKLSPDVPFVHVYAADTNVASMSLFGQKLGWSRCETKCYWIQCEAASEESVDHE